MARQLSCAEWERGGGGFLPRGPWAGSQLAYPKGGERGREFPAPRILAQTPEKRAEEQEASFAAAQGLAGAALEPKPLSLNLISPKS